MALLRGLCSKVGQSVLQAERLLQRKLIVVRGLESSEFLQGLVTNDVGHLGRGNSSIYAMFLNKGGRVLYDTIIYKTPKEEDSFLLECDSAVADQLVKHLKMYRVRRKIDIERTDEKQVWVVFDGGSVKLPKKIDTDKVICTDPRLKNLGTRIVTSASDDMSHISSIFEEAQEASEGSYRKHRYDLGIGEGVVDLPREKSFPLEANVDFLNGVSFHKGCYVGQELTARTHHTGVVRKRLMPLRLKQPLEVVESADLEVQNEQGQNVGKLRGHLDGIGLALLRIEPAMAAQKVIIAGTGVECEPYKPGWWPTSDPQNLKHMMQKVEEERPVIEFRCSACGMEETCEYRGTTPKFVRNVRFTEEVYVMRDPFSPPPSGSESRKSLSEYYLVLGADCSGCRKTVCKAPECSFFYSRTFCLPCAMDSIREFPLEIQSKIRKQVAK